MKKILLIICFMIPLFLSAQTIKFTYTFKISTITSETDLKTQKTQIQNVMGINGDIQFINGNVVVVTSENYVVGELAFKLNKNNFMVIGHINKTSTKINEAIE